MERTLENVGVVIPVWGMYLQYLPSLLGKLKAEGVLNKNICIVTKQKEEVLGLVKEDLKIIEANNSIGIMRNLGALHLKTKYLYFADADDLPYPGSIKELHTEINKLDNPAFVTGQVVDKNKEPYTWPSEFYKKERSSFYRKLLQVSYNHLPCASSSLIDRQIFLNIGGFVNTNFAEDGILMTELLFAGEYKILNKPTRIYGQNKDGLFQKGVPTKTWRHSYSLLRKKLRRSDCVNIFWKSITFLYTPVHCYYSWALSRQKKIKDFSPKS